MKKYVFAFSLIFFTSFLFGQIQVKPEYYLIFFKDKDTSMYDTAHPQVYLSEKAIKRRHLFNIKITTQDFPVSQKYIKTLRDSGYNVLLTSRWLNAALIHETDSSKLQKIKTFNFIDTLGLDKFRQPKDSSAEQIKYTVEVDSSVYPQNWEKRYNYGYALRQNAILDVPLMHALGFDGQGVTIAMLDAGFYKVDSFAAFDSLVAQHRILGYYDFVDIDTNVFDQGTHGLMALSTIAAQTKKYVGSAPKASFYLFRTEDGSSEYPIEEFNWVVAAEHADSAGADIISSSLGYETFDDPNWGYEYENMNGNYAISTIGADIAASKGIIVVVSAGNSGDSKWHYIGAPADGDSVISVGAVTYDGDPAFFSAYGPTADGRIKPDVAAVGTWTTVIGEKGKVTFASGTSFSAPTVAGAVACLKQAHPDKSNMEILRALQMSGDHASEPDDHVGYGVPDIFLAHLILQQYDLKKFDPHKDKIVIKPSDTNSK